MSHWQIRDTLKRLYDKMCEEDTTFIVINDQREALMTATLQKDMALGEYLNLLRQRDRASLEMEMSHFRGSRNGTNNKHPYTYSESMDGQAADYFISKAASEGIQITGNNFLKSYNKFRCKTMGRQDASWVSRYCKRRAKRTAKPVVGDPLTRAMAIMTSAAQELSDLTRRKKAAESKVRQAILEAAKMLRG